MISPHLVMAMLYCANAVRQIQRDTQAHEEWSRQVNQRCEDSQREYEILILERAWRLDR